MRVEVTCPNCGEIWQSQSLTGKTRCRSCRHQVYIPTEIRDHARQTGQIPRYEPARQPALYRRRHAPQASRSAPIRRKRADASTSARLLASLGLTNTPRVPKPRQGTAQLACGHETTLRGDPAAWYGVAVPCPHCGVDRQVLRTSHRGTRR